MHMVEVYNESGGWYVKLNEIGLAAVAASDAEPVEDIRKLHMVILTEDGYVKPPTLRKRFVTGKRRRLPDND